MSVFHFPPIAFSALANPQSSSGSRFIFDPYLNVTAYPKVRNLPAAGRQPYQRASQILELDLMTTIGFLGAGRMGTALVRTLLKNGHHVHVWNRTAEKAEALAAFGAVPASRPEASIDGADIVIVNLLDYSASDAQLRKPAVMQALKGKLLVQLTSGSPKTARNTGIWATDNGIAYLDGAIMATPNVIGSSETLILYSGSASHYEKHATLFAELGGKSAFVGEDFGKASALDSALLAQMWGTLFGTLQALAINRAESIDADTYAGFLPLVQPVIDAAEQDLMQRVRDGRDRGDDDTLASIAAHGVAFHHLREIVRERGINSAISDAFGSLLETAIAKGHQDDDFAMLARFMVTA
ncbi:NAD(P)-dependent oxidoreductase [Rhizobium leguminosarum]|uniref:NAD(P)-dependent oxidoreductase n=1 Tax=Rhizobium leguminosarum TaxID=384 RepID=UPI0021BC0C1B|nr:NAD(P)-binding domain-containing protein [Rhizobium leguminosarum]MBY5720505.1 NAD(P)-dependent oxidoreductase [Rhizobium leguminosarum]